MKVHESAALPRPRSMLSAFAHKPCDISSSCFSSATRSEFSLTNMIGRKICAAKDRRKNRDSWASLCTGWEHFDGSCWESAAVLLSIEIISDTDTSGVQKWTFNLYSLSLFVPVRTRWPPVPLNCKKLEAPLRTCIKWYNPVNTWESCPRSWSNVKDHFHFPVIYLNLIS